MRGVGAQTSATMCCSAHLLALDSHLDPLVRVVFVELIDDDDRRPPVGRHGLGERVGHCHGEAGAR